MNLAKVSQESSYQSRGVIEASGKPASKTPGALAKFLARFVSSAPSFYPVPAPAARRKFPRWFL